MLFSNIIYLYIVVTVHGKLIPDQTNDKKLSECDQCKLFTKSFDYWYEKTKRGKFEGGDALWEESKLKAYARSEVRLVEIQESLCSELKTDKDKCYLLLEETEDLFERWWFSEDPADADLHTWLCIQNLLRCCPFGHYGKNCDSCPTNQTLVCNGNGKCDGEGTRKGDGKCKCNKGHIGLLCNECDKDYYMESDFECQPCHFSCDECTSGGANSCINCKKGWQKIGNECIDVDECLDDPCKETQYCLNLEGSYTCNVCYKSCKACLSSHSNNCTECVDDYILFKNSCIDKDTKQALLKQILYKICMYVGFLVVLVYMSRKFKILASISAVIVALYIYHTEYHNQEITGFVELVISI